MMCWIGTVLTVGTLRLVFYWRPDWLLKCTCITASLSKAEYVLLEVWISLFISQGGHATNLEYSGISLNMENSGNFQGILCNLGKNCNKQKVRHSNICVKQLLTG